MAAPFTAYETVEQLQAKIDEYFKLCDNANKKRDDKGRLIIDEPYSVAALADYLDICRTTLYDWANDSNNAKSYTIKKAIDKIAAWQDKNTLLGKLHPIYSIFSAKNYLGLTDKQEVEHSVNSSNISDDDLDRLIEARLQKTSNPALIEAKTDIQ